MLIGKAFLWPLAALLCLTACNDSSAEEKGAPQPLVINGAEVSPLCFAGSFGPEPIERFPLTSCDQNDVRADPEGQAYDDLNFIATDYLSDFTNDDGTVESFPGFIGYRYLGETQGYHAVLTTENTGGSGFFSAIYLLEQEGEQLIVRDTIAGGDRCNGGIKDAAVVDGALHYSINITPYDFFEIADYNPSDLTAYDDIAACAACCYGTLNMEGGNPVSVTLDEEAFMIGTEDDQLQACFDKEFQRTLTDPANTKTITELKTFLEEFQAACLSAP